MHVNVGFLMRSNNSYFKFRYFSKKNLVIHKQLTKQKISNIHEHNVCKVYYFIID